MTKHAYYYRSQQGDKNKNIFLLKFFLIKNGYIYHATTVNIGKLPITVTQSDK